MSGGESQKEVNEKAVKTAISLGIEDFFSESQLAVDGFIRRHYCYPGCWKTNRVAFGFDLLRAPINLIWAPIYIAILLVILLLSRCGFKRCGPWVSRIPGGMTTNVQRNINTKIDVELLERERLTLCIRGRLEHLHPTLENSVELSSYQQNLESIVDESLKQLMQTRTAVADISNTMLSTIVGALVFKKFTPGGIGIGILATSMWLNYRASENFFLGSALGGVYYSFFPKQASLLENSLGVFLAMVVLAVLASFSGLLTDPIQSILGLHRRRLRKMLVQIEKDFVEKKDSRFKTIDPYVARILELFDTLKSQIMV